MFQRVSWMLLLVIAGVSTSNVVAAQGPSSGVIGTSPAADPQSSAIVVEDTTEPGTNPNPNAIPVVEQAPVVTPVMVPATTFVPFNRPRFRFGFSIQGGPSVPTGSGSSSGGFGGAAVRLGAQINRMWGVYYHMQAVIGGYGYISPTGTSTNVFIGAYNAVAGSVTLFDRLEFGFGPSFDAIDSVHASASNGSSGGSASASVFAGTAFGLHARAAIMLGRLNPARLNRSGFSFSLDVHPTFMDGQVLLTTAIGLGGEWY